jgi:hypothetical protein
MNINGTSKADTLTGTAGGDGIDLLYGGNGTDSLDGGAGADTMAGGPAMMSTWSTTQATQWSRMPIPATIPLTPRCRLMSWTPTWKT